MTSLLLRRAEVEPGALCDVRVEQGRIAAIEASLPNEHAAFELDVAGGALLRGLNDHHIHLFALAAARRSVACGPPAVNDRAELVRALEGAAARLDEGDWIRGVAYHESVAGPLGRDELDALLGAGPPLRIQHRTGAMWMLNSAALERIEGESWPEGVECDEAGRPTGRIYAQDDWLRERLGDAAFPDLSEVGRELARCGVVGVSDATPDKERATLEALDAAMRSGALPQRVVAMGGLDDQPGSNSRLERGEHKVMLRERALPAFDDLVERIRAAHAQDRGVAFHCVTRSELVLAAGALRAAKVHARDRIEHASIAPDDLVALLAELGVTVVTQPGFVHERGDVYLRDVDPEDRPWLYRGSGFLDGGVRLGGGTDAPYGDADPWRAIRAAVDRRTRSGAHVGEGEGLTPERALALFTSPLESPGAVRGRLRPGEPADLCVLDCPWSVQRAALTREHVRASIAGGRLIYLRDDG